MSMSSKKPYYIRALYDWILDNNCTPYILVNADYPGVEVPLEHVNSGRIVLNISPDACRGLHMENDRIVFTARFSGKTTQIYIHPSAVMAIYAQENGEGKEFGREYDDANFITPVKKQAVRKPSLTLVKPENNE
jgi:stringent starvation protein B